MLFSSGVETCQVNNNAWVYRGSCVLTRQTWPVAHKVFHNAVVLNELCRHLAGLRLEHMTDLRVKITCTKQLALLNEIQAVF